MPTTLINYMSTVVSSTNFLVRGEGGEGGDVRQVH